MTDCIFCKIAAKEIPAELVYEGEHVVAFRDINPQAPTHVQLIPRTHVDRIAEFSAVDDSAWLAELFTAAAKIAADERLDGGFRLVFNNGGDAGQSVWHVHMHLLGGRRMSWPPG